MCEREINNDSVFVPLGKDAFLSKSSSQFVAFVLNHVVFRSLLWVAHKIRQPIAPCCCDQTTDCVCMCVLVCMWLTPHLQWCVFYMCIMPKSLSAVVCKLVCMLYA